MFCQAKSVCARDVVCVCVCERERVSERVRERERERERERTMMHTNVTFTCSNLPENHHNKF